MFRFLFFICFIFTTWSYANNSLAEPYSKISLLPFDPQGWYANGEQLESLIKSRKVKTIVEVGCWLGLSTRHMASILPPNGKLYAVDHWLGSIEHTTRPEFSQILPCLYEQFLSNVIHAKLTDIIIPIRMDSQKAAFYLESVSPDLVYLDASHDTASVHADLIAWFPLIRGHGILCGDDWYWESVRVAVNHFAFEHRLKVESCGNFWRLEENE
jgi:hypothetical protein